jgi:hypothetical protein
MSASPRSPHSADPCSQSLQGGTCGGCGRTLCAGVTSHSNSASAIPGLECLFQSRTLPSSGRYAGKMHDDQPAGGTPEGSSIPVSLRPDLGGQPHGPAVTGWLLSRSAVRCTDRPDSPDASRACVAPNAGGEHSTPGGTLHLALPAGCGFCPGVRPYRGSWVTLLRPGIPAMPITGSASCT